MKKLLLPGLILSFCFICLTSVGQGNTAALPPDFSALNYSAQMPENLLHTKSAVFVHVPASDGKVNWKTLAQQAHKAFRDAGIDAVAYYYYEDVKAGRDASQQLAADLKSRQIQNIILLLQDGQQYTLLIAPFNGESSFVAQNQGAFKMEAGKSDQLFFEFGKAVFRSGMVVENHLINDQPEFFVGAGNVIHGKRYEAFAQDLKLDKLAVPRFQEVKEQPATTDSTAEQSLSPDDQKLESIMKEYPYEYGLVNPQLEEDKVRQQGYQYILLRLHTTPEHLHDMLGYKASSEAPAQRASSPAPVYKYYIKHIYTGDVYLGDVWDADTHWEKALANYIQNMKAGLNIGK